jgi:hypothetical protein
MKHGLALDAKNEPAVAAGISVAQRNIYTAI